MAAEGNDASRSERRAKEPTNVSQFQSDSVLHKACYAGEFQKVKSILQRNKRSNIPDINARNRLGCTALRLASTTGHADCVNLLIQHGADVNISDIKAQTPLFVAVKNRHLDCVGLLLRAGAEPDGDAYSLCSPTYIAAMDGFTEGLKLLLDHGADPEVSMLRVGWFNSTPLYVSIAYHHFSCLRVLLLAGAEPDKIPIVSSPTNAYDTTLAIPSRASTPQKPPSPTGSVSSQNISASGSSLSETPSPTHPATNHYVVDRLTPPPLPPPLLAPPFRPRVSKSKACQSLYDATVKHNVEKEYVQLLYDFGASLYRSALYRETDSLPGSLSRGSLVDDASESRRASLTNSRSDVAGSSIVSSMGDSSTPYQGVALSRGDLAASTDSYVNVISDEAASNYSSSRSRQEQEQVQTERRAERLNEEMRIVLNRENNTSQSRDNECARFILQLISTPRSLMSCCRLAIRKSVGRRHLNLMSQQSLGVPNKAVLLLINGHPEKGPLIESKNALEIKQMQKFIKKNSQNVNYSAGVERVNNVHVKFNHMSG